ncbi:hypothetical protein Acr_00g0084180 [Actinidia rufa]|uniref:Retrovirus-related Pol polyprotein from transposon TNT 1-94-like beta-barrel domain-containing protein n=1 Tax=Actinidia rufa TaxID=165716 RepID=A0A7J0DV30_9ERIC|nr:hypothetical protein Acr_00g0084180 [Actinidia rufa]
MDGKNTVTIVVGKWSVRFCMEDGRSMTLTEVRHVPNLQKNLISIGMLDLKGCSFEANGGTLRVSKGNKEMLREGRLEGYTNWRGVSKLGKLLSDMGPVVLARRMDKGSNRCTEARKASAGDVQREAQRKETKSILEAVQRRDFISGGDLSSCAHKGGEMEPRQLAK